MITFLRLLDSRLPLTLKKVGSSSHRGKHVRRRRFRPATDDRLGLEYTSFGVGVPKGVSHDARNCRLVISSMPGGLSTQRICCVRGHRAVCGVEVLLASPCGQQGVSWAHPRVS